LTRFNTTASSIGRGIFRDSPRFADYWLATMGLLPSIRFKSRQIFALGLDFPAITIQVDRNLTEADAGKTMLGGKNHSKWTPIWLSFATLSWY